MNVECCSYLFYKLSRLSDNMESKNVLDVNCQTQGRLKLMIEHYVSEICHKFQIPYWRV
jgi:hypothetical protein